MYYVYILQSSRNKQLYKGFATSVLQRVKIYNKGSVPSTARFRPWQLVYYAGFPDKQRALDFERYLKTASGIAFMRKRLA